MDFPPIFPATNAQPPGGGGGAASAVQASVSRPDLGAGEKNNPILAARFLFLEHDTRLRLYILKHAKISQRNCVRTGRAGKSRRAASVEAATGPSPSGTFTQQQKAPSWHSICGRTVAGTQVRPWWDWPWTWCGLIASAGCRPARPVHAGHAAEGVVSQRELRERLQCTSVVCAPAIHSPLE